MKFVFLLSSCLMFASVSGAAPNITEIRFEEAPGTLRQPIIKNEFVFRADGNFQWTEGTLEKPIVHRYSINKQEFATLAASLETHGFFELKPLYDRAKPTDSVSLGGDSVVVGARRDGLWTNVVDYSGFGPSNLWDIEMIIRGFASKHIGLKRGPAQDKPIRTSPPQKKAPVPIIRGTKKAPK